MGLGGCDRRSGAHSARYPFECGLYEGTCKYLIICTLYMGFDFVYFTVLILLSLATTYSSNA